MKKIINKIRKLILVKKLKEETNISGKYEIEDDKILCYVSSEKLKDQTRGPYGYNLIFTDIKSSKKKYSKQIKKPIDYIIENEFFDKRINFLISTPFCSITFKNCTFKEGIFIGGKNVSFINCTYEACEYSRDKVISENHFYIMTVGSAVQNIKFINNLLRITNVTNPIIDIWIAAENIELTNSNIVNLNSLELTCDTLSLNKTSITTKKSCITAKSIEECNSILITVKVAPEEPLPGVDEKSKMDIVTKQNEEKLNDYPKNIFVKKLIKKKENK